ncbi:hypothetical protein PCASD_12028 [Puccinia coronata f. sp. avenae]|uniref:beta-galactosidase n=1 Tax=Puccinia coronata f. sp. avenae TaxID=200324 RepID=A0A2N5TBL0_9BASI|nr:hypothetical protein PCASD_12028 [Puccinia coronata f. sp. avenae]
MKLRLSLLTLGLLQAGNALTSGKTASLKSQSVVSWDRYSILLRGERKFIQSGEFHPWRLPVVSLWTDILQKFTAAGLNTVSIYVHWGLVNPINGTTDWTGFKSLQPFFDAARSAGLFVIVRPGPYINAETTAGGIPGWVTTLSCPLRTNATDFDRAWRQYWNEMIDLIAPNQIGLPNGTIIAVQVENEYLTDAHSSGQPSGKDQYMHDLAEALTAKGIVVPLTVNDAGMDKNYATGLGAVDIYGFDSYPQSFDCSKPTNWKPVVETYRSYQDSLNLQSPLFIPEFQAGAYDPWGATGYENCRKLTGPEFESVFYLNNLAANIKMINYYMLYGGTNWGQLAFPGTYTSYDYGSAISEDRTLNEKYTELKRQSFFLRSSNQFYQTEVVGDSKRDPDYFVGEDSDSAFVTELRNPTSGAGFYIVRALDSTSTEPTRFRLNVLTSVGLKQLPQITLSPRESRLLVTDYQTSSQNGNPDEPSPIKLLYTTSNVLLSARIGGHEVLYLFSNIDQQISQDTGDVETSSIQIPTMETDYWTKSFPETSKSPTFQISTETDSQGYREINWQLRDQAGVFALGSHKSLVLMTSKRMAGEVWNPILDEPDSSKPSSSVLIWGPWLVRNASIGVVEGTKKRVLRIWGDFEEGLKKEVIIYVGGLLIEGVEWNGKKIWNLTRAPESGFLSFLYHPTSFESSMKNKPVNQLSQVGSRIDLQTLNWTYRDSLPEIGRHYSDQKWTQATLEESNNPYKKLYGKHYLYACDYGFCNGATIWRGHFHHKCPSLFPDQHYRQSSLQLESPIGINLTITGGDFFAASVWLNDQFLGSVPNATSKSDPKLYSRTQMNTFYFPPGSHQECGSNVITVVQDSMGMDQTEDGFSDTVKHPRGILGYRFEGQSVEDSLGEISWKVQGQLGGFDELPDPDRGIYNENGFYGIRSGWHLPGDAGREDGLEWTALSPISDGLTSAGIGFYSTTFNLDFAPGYDVILSFVFSQPPVDHPRYRLEFWVNGWHMGKFVSHLGPQTRFPVHQGILNYQGNNFFALVLWALDPEGAKINGGIELVVDQILEGGIGPIHTDKHPPYNHSRRIALL